MWIGKGTLALIEDLRSQIAAIKGHAWQLEGERTRLEVENTRLRSDMDWFKHRLTQSEHERGMLMQDRLGVRISVPKFVDDSEGVALHEMPSLSTIGGDAAPEHDSDVEVGQGVDYSLLPGYKGTRA